MTLPADPPGPLTAPRRRGQFSVRTVILATAVVTVWTAYVVQLAAIPALEARVQTLSALDGGLVVEDATQIAVVQRLDPWWGDQPRWDVHLPEGAYRLCLAMRQVGAEGLAPVMASAPIAPGQRAIAFKYVPDSSPEAYHLVVTIDGQEAIPPQVCWNSLGDASRRNSLRPGIVEQHAPDAPLVLHRMTFDHMEMFKGIREPIRSQNGVLLWIEPVPATKDSDR